MKTTSMSLCLGLSAALWGACALAATGTANLQGRITAATCPIEVVNPEDGSVGSLVKMGSVDASRFSRVGQEQQGKSFVLRLDNSNKQCGLQGHERATVTFNGRTDANDTQTYGLIPSSESATGIAIAIRDKSGAALAPGIASAKYDLNQSGVTDMLFDAFYRATARGVRAGAASTDVSFIVAIN